MITVFYGGLVYDRYTTWRELRAEITEEVFQGGFAYDPALGNSKWWTLDGCPYPEDQIDPRLKAWLVLLE